MINVMDAEAANRAHWNEIAPVHLKSYGLDGLMAGTSRIDDTKQDDLQIIYPYFHQKEPIHLDDDCPDYSDTSYIPVNKTYEWIWSLSDIVNSLIRNGLRIEMLNEYDRLFYQALPEMVRVEDDWWILKKYKGMIPLTFTLRARKQS